VISRRDENGRREVIFEPPGHDEVEGLTVELVDRYNEACELQKAHRLVLLAAFVLDLLSIHPVADGNGRLARLLTTHELLRAGYGVARYVSVEQRIWETKNAYYEALRQSQTGWHDAEHDIWPWVEYLIGTLAHSYEDFEAKIATSRSTKGLTKQEIVSRHILALPTGRTFRVRDLRSALRGISDPTFRIVLKELKRSGEVDVDGSGPGAVWTRTAPVLASQP
jgi:Fic family protein